MVAERSPFKAGGGRGAPRGAGPLPLPRAVGYLVAAAASLALWFGAATLAAGLIALAHWR
jgi:hypothetical protein